MLISDHELTIAGMPPFFKFDRGNLQAFSRTPRYSISDTSNRSICSCLTHVTRNPRSKSLYLNAGRGGRFLAGNGPVNLRSFISSGLQATSVNRSGVRCSFRRQTWFVHHARFHVRQAAVSLFLHLPSLCMQHVPTKTRPTTDHKEHLFRVGPFHVELSVAMRPESDDLDFCWLVAEQARQAGQICVNVHVSDVTARAAGDASNSSTLSPCNFGNRGCCKHDRLQALLWAVVWC